MAKIAKLFSITLLVISLFGIAEFLAPQKASAIILCSNAYTPRIEVDIAGETITSSSPSGSGSVEIDPNTAIDFTVRTISEPSSQNGISYPGPGSPQTYPGPLHTGRPYDTYTLTTSNTPATIQIWLGFNCEFDGTSPPPDTNLNITINVSSPPTNYNLTVTKAGTGSGTVTSSPSGVNCGSDCSQSYSSGTSVTLTAAPTSGSTFASWSGSCSGTAATCTVSMTAARSVTATFNTVPAPPPGSYNLVVTKAGTGSGTVTSSPSGVNCGSDCSQSYSSGTSVTLTRSASSGSTFAGWSGSCSGTGSTCTVSMTAARNVTATFNTSGGGNYTLTVTKSGTAASSGTVTSSPSGINCGSDCSQSYSSGTSVTLTASGTGFAGWSGSCSGTGSTCTVSMTAARSVTATFNTSASCTDNATVSFTTPPPATLSPGENYTFSLNASNVGDTSWYHGSAYLIRKLAGPTILVTECTNGTNPNTTDYSQVCRISEPGGIVQTWKFSGTAPTTPGTYTIDMKMEHAPDWNYRLPVGGQCAPAPGSAVKFGNTSSASFTVGATLATSIDSGSGTITGPGINCPGDCSESFSSVQWVTLIATPSAGYAFSSWTGACAGQGSSCSVLMDAAKSTGANFTAPFNYSLSNSGTSNVTKSSGNAYTQNIISKTVIGIASQPVSLTLSGVPSGVSYSIANDPCSPTCSSTITFTVAPSAPVGTFPITVTGSPLNKQTSFNLVISGNPSTVSCSASPATALLGETVTWTADVSGGTPPYTYAWSGTNIPTSPAPSTNPYARSYSTIGQKNAAVVVTDADDVASSCPPVTIQINFNPSFEEF